MHPDHLFEYMVRLHGVEEALRILADYEEQEPPEPQYKPGELYKLLTEGVRDEAEQRRRLASAMGNAYGTPFFDARLSKQMRQAELMQQQYLYAQAMMARQMPPLVIPKDEFYAPEPQPKVFPETAYENMMRGFPLRGFHVSDDNWSLR